MMRKFGRPDLFVAFTCNPTWVDILNVLEGQQHPEDSYTYSKIRAKDDIDKYVSAELPYPIADPTLFQIITRCMIHGPCRTLNPNSPCMREGVCTKQYPKEFREKTEENINGYPMYQRKCTESVRVGRHDLDNRWVVPYNLWLSKNFNAPIHVEVCASIKSVKYLYKYVYKGHDAASIRFENEKTLDQDEILSFLDGWYVIAYQYGQEEEAVARAATRQTTLTAWFELNKNDQDSHNYLYTDIPHYYTFNKSAMKWQKRQRGGEQVIGRMPVVNIQDSERYYLRLLLLRKLGAVSFEDLKTVDGIVCNTFQQACKMQGLLEGDQH
ncbi:hypothetical protein AVEN_208321-1 [Araneus ventricosus]|uniref:Helitron helicase-like domain-containing protein n=1 Tax=Araneus ventricosus TaxID=182803 RepID=A0A4Y2NEL5_ARAVE|nr:hypothetical protein AVEN_208321-1 [Araneus ventricosus]